MDAAVDWGLNTNGLDTEPGMETCGALVSAEVMLVPHVTFVPTGLKLALREIFSEPTVKVSVSFVLSASANVKPVASDHSVNWNSNV